MNYYIPMPDWMNARDERVRRAFMFAMTAHASVQQVRKYTGEPYIVHPVAVAKILHDHGATDDQVAAALLHDVVEDTEITPLMVVAEFGQKIAMLVGWLTDVSQPGDGNRAARKALDREHAMSAPAEAQTIKVADLMDNTKSITEYDPNFANVYINEKALLLEGLKQADPDLRKQAWEQVNDFRKDAVMIASKG